MPEPLPEHIQWLADNNGQAMRNTLVGHGVDIGVEEALRVLVEVDPSPGLQAVPWLCLRYLAGGYLWEDVAGGKQSKAAETLELFAQHRHALHGHACHIEHYSSLAAVHAAIAPYVVDPETDNSVSGRALRREQKALAWSQSIIVCNRPDLVVAIPLSRMAAQWWGRGTRWCTAGREDNVFKHYNQQAPLVVISLLARCTSADNAIPEAGTSPSWGKLQLHVPLPHEMPEAGVQFMDAGDNPVEPEFIWQHWNQLGWLIQWGLERSPAMLEHVPQHLRTWEQCMQAIQANPSALELVSPQWRTQQMCLAALELDSHAIQHVPACYLTPELELATVQKNGYALQHIANPGRELCLASVGSRGNVLHMVPPEYRDSELCAVALARSGRCINDVRPELLSAHLCTLAVQSWGGALRFVPAHLVTYELCLAACIHNGYALKHVPPEFVDRAMCSAAVEYRGKNTRWQNNSGLSFVPAQFMDAELCRLAVTSSGSALRYVPQHLVSPELCGQAVLSFPAAIECVPETMMTPRLCLDAVAADSSAFYYVPQAYQTPELCLEALRAEGSLLSYVRDDLKTLELCRAALDNDPDCLAWVPDALVPLLDVDPNAITALQASCRPGPGWDAEQVRVELEAALARHGGTGWPRLPWTLLLDPAERNQAFSTPVQAVIQAVMPGTGLGPGLGLAWSR